MKTTSKFSASVLLIATALFVCSCGTFFKTNIIDDAEVIRDWLKESGYEKKSNGFFFSRLPNSDNTTTLTKNILFGSVDDVIRKGSVLAERIKPIDKLQRFFCNVDFSDGFYFITCVKEYLVDIYDSVKKVIVPNWLTPYKITYYLKKDQTNKQIFLESLASVESEFTMDYSQFIKMRTDELEEYEEIRKAIEEQRSEEGSKF